MNNHRRRIVPAPVEPAAESTSSASNPKESKMDKDRIKGAIDQAKGAVKTTLGEAVGDAKLKADGQADKLKGKIESAVGGVKDTVRDATKK